MNWVEFAVKHEESISSAKISFMKWKTWYKGKPSPEPIEKAIWNY